MVSDSKHSPRRNIVTNWSISAKILVLIIVSLFLTIIVLVFSNYLFNSNNNTQEVGVFLNNLGSQALQRSIEKVSDGAQVLQTLAMNSAIVEAAKTANTARAAWDSEKIKTLDKAWIDKNASIAELEKEITNHPLSDFLKSFVSKNPAEVEVFITDAKGLNIAMTDRTSDFLQGDESWWTAAFNNGSGAVFVDKVSYDESSKSYAMNIGVPIIDPQSNKAIGVLRGTLDVSTVITVLGDLKVGKTGHVLLLDGAGNILYSPEAGQLMKPATAAEVNLFKNQNSGWAVLQDVDGESAIVGYNLQTAGLGKSLGWRILVIQHQGEANQSLVNVLLISLGMSVAAGLVSLLIAILASRSITHSLVTLTSSIELLAKGDLKLTGQDRAYLERVSQQREELGAMYRASFSLLGYLEEMTSAAQQVAQGDLTVEVKPRSKADQLGSAFAGMIATLQRQVGEVAENTRSLQSASADLAEAARQAGGATNQIALTIQQLTSGTTQQSSAVNRTAEAVDQMGQLIQTVARGAGEQSNAVDRAAQVTAQISRSIEQVAGNAQAVTDDATRAAQAARAGYQTVEDTVKGMQMIKEKVGLSASKVQEMGSRSDQIGAIVETIEDIASQTNLLALNAAIEAARAGEHGKGFAVVADEVRKLAERASSATKEIGGLIHGIQQTVNDAVAAMNASAREVENGVDNANQAGVALKSILEAAESVNQQAMQAYKAAGQMSTASKDLVNSVDTVAKVIRQSAQATDRMSANSAEVSQAIENIASVSEQNSASFEEVAASTEQMTAQVDQVTQSAAALSEMAQNLQAVVDQFNLEGE